MVTKYGFSEKLGPVNYSSSDEVFLGKDFSTRQNYSEETASEIDEEVKAIIEEAYEAAKTILSEHMEQLTAVAEGLLAVETLDNQQFERLYDGDVTPEELAEELRIELEKKKARNEKEAAQSARKRKKEAGLEKQRLEEAARALEEQTKNSKFKPSIMIYNEETKTAEPFNPTNLSKPGDSVPDGDMPEDDDFETPEQPEVHGEFASDDDFENAAGDDDMPSEEELAVYDTDYLNADDDDDSEVDADDDDADDEDSLDVFADDDGSDSDDENRKKDE